MPVGIGQLKRQAGGLGYFAQIKLEVTPSDSPSRVEFGEHYQETHYVSAIKVGINYAWERLLFEHQSPPFYRIKVVEFVTSNVDTTEMAVVYVAAMAFCNALGLELENPIEIDFEKRRISFVL